jgi:hypothetical protein
LSQSRTLDSAIKAVRDLCIPLAAIHTWSDAAAAVIRDAEPPAATPADTEGWLGVLTKPSLKVFGYQFKYPRMGQVVLVCPLSSRKSLLILRIVPLIQDVETRC